MPNERPQRGRRRLVALTLLAGASIVALVSRDGRDVPAGKPGPAQGPRVATGPRIELPAKPVSKDTTTTEAAPVDSSALAATRKDDEKAPAAITNGEILLRTAAGESGFEVLASRVPVEVTHVAPRWQAGDEWVVETFYRQMQAHDETWSGPALWRFRVERETSFRDQPCFEVVVTRGDEPNVAPTIVYIARDELRLVGFELSVKQQGKTRRIVEIGDDARGPAAVRLPLSIVPFDLPPAGIEARVNALGATLPGRARQKSALFPANEELIGAGSSYLDVEYESPRDRTTVRQRWSTSDLRWPVVSRTETTVSFRRK